MHTRYVGLLLYKIKGIIPLKPFYFFWKLYFTHNIDMSVAQILKIICHYVKCSSDCGGKDNNSESYKKENVKKKIRKKKRLQWDRIKSIKSKNLNNF